jgi:hypothetical protein
MPHPAPTPIEIPWPIRGINRGDRANMLGPDFALAARNVRNFPPSSDRSGGGKRWGTKRAIAIKAGPESSPRVRHMIPRSRASGVPALDGFSAEFVSDDFSAPLATTGKGNIGFNYVRGNVDVSGRVTLGCTGTITGIHTQLVTGTPNTFTFNRSQDSSGINRAMLAVAFFTTNDFEATFSFTRIASSSNGNDGVAGECHNIGPFIRGEETGPDSMIACRLSRQGANSVRFEIVRLAGGTITVLANSAANTALDGGAASDCTMRIYETGSGDEIKAEIDWPSGGMAETLTLNSSSLSGNKRAGVICLNGSTTGNSILSWRILKEVAFTKLIPGNNQTKKLLQGVTPNTTNGDQYHLPQDYRAVSLNVATGALTTQDGFASSVADPAYIAIDDSADVIWDTSSAPTANVLRGIEPKTAPPAGETWGVEFQLRAYPTSSDFDMIGAGFRCDDNLTEGLFVQFGQHVGGTDEDQTGCVTLNGGGVVTFDGGAIVTEVSLNVGISISQPLLFEHTKLQWGFDGAIVELKMNGMVVHRRTLSAGELAAVAAFGNAGTRTIALMSWGRTATNRCDVGTEYLRWVLLEGTAATDIGEVDTQIAVYTAGLVQIGDLDNEDLVDTAGLGLNNILPSGFSQSNKFYAVDGTRSVITDPITLETTDWTATAGVFPEGCRLGCLYRGRGVLARQDDNPSIWYMTRINDMQDFDFGADPVTTSAAFGNNAKIGQPADAIVALIPWEDDLLIFGCATSLWQMVGDPGYGGQVQNLTRETGIIGPRAWCFDGMGTLYFLGTGGLHRLVKGSSTPEPMGGKRMHDAIERIDAAANLVQLAYDALTRTIEIFITPTDDTTAGVPIVYDVENDALLEDDFPQPFGPTAVCQIVGDTDEDRRFLFGGYDGWIRRPDDTLKSDDVIEDETAVNSINAYIEFFPLEAALGIAETMLHEIQATLHEGSGEVTWRWFVARSPDQVRRLTVGQEETSGTWGGDPDELGGGGGDDGEQEAVGLRVSGAAHKLRIEQDSATETFAMDKIVVFSGARRRRR